MMTEAKLVTNRSSILKVAAVLLLGASVPACATKRVAPEDPKPRRAAHPRVGAISRPKAAGGTVPRAADKSLPHTVALETRTGTASYYSDKLHNRRTASGVRYDRNALVAAHRTYPFGTVLRVTNLKNERWVTVRVVDRGPFTKGLILDVSRRAAEELGFIGQGLTRVKIEVLAYGSGEVE
jgi:rare lipoprotein A